MRLYSEETTDANKVYIDNKMIDLNNKVDTKLSSVDTTINNKISEVDTKLNDIPDVVSVATAMAIALG